MPHFCFIMRGMDVGGPTGKLNRSSSASSAFWAMSSLKWRPSSPGGARRFAYSSIARSRPVTIADCVRVTKALGLVLEATETLPGPYNSRFPRRDSRDASRSPRTSRDSGGSEREWSISTLAARRRRRSAESSPRTRRRLSSPWTVPSERSRSRASCERICIRRPRARRGRNAGNRVGSAGAKDFDFGRGLK